MITHHDIEAMRDDTENGETIHHGNPKSKQEVSEQQKLPLACKTTIEVMYAYYTGRTL